MNGDHSAPPRLAHVAALDGLRGIAVATVVAFHANWLTGGWVGVDVFFVLSGYLITRLLLIERANGRISLVGFWSRRFRRLMPALLVLIAVVAVVERQRGRLTGPTGARWDVAGALTYLSNWFRLRDGVGYWSNFGGPSLLDHVWSLAIEEQFYVVWPLLMVAVTWRSTRVPSRSLIAGLSVATVGLGAWSLWWFARTGDANRVYLGTDTRAVAIVLGAAVGALHQHRGDRRSSVERGVGWLALAVLSWAFIDLGGLELRTYRGGLLGCSVAAGALVWSIGGDAHRLSRSLSVRPLRWLGARSYGIYLWHWPVMVALDVAKNEQSTNVRRVLAIVATAAIAEASYRLIEMPIRRRGLRAIADQRMATVTAGLVTVAVAVAAAYLPSGSPPVVAAAGAPLSIPVTVEPTSIPEPVPTVASVSAGISPVPLPASRPARVLVVGDSVGWFFGNTLFEAQASLGINVEVQAIPSCPPIRADVAQRVGPGAVSSSYGAECREKVNAYRDDVARFDPDVVLMMFGGALFGEFELSPGEWSDACGAPFRPWFVDELSALVDDLGSQGATVMIATEANYREPSVTGDFPRLDAQSACKNLIVADAVESLAASGKQVGLVPLGEWVCPTPGECLESRQGIVLRPDGVHLKDWSAIIAWQWMVPQLFEPAPTIIQ